MPFFIPVLIAAGAAAAKGAAAAGATAAAVSKIAALKAVFLSKAFMASSAALSAGAVGAQALASGVAARSAAVQRNAQVQAQIEANRRTAAEIEASRQQALEVEKQSAFQFGREASVRRGNLLAQIAGLGGVGGSSDLLSALAASQFTEAEMAQTRFQGAMNTNRAQQVEISRQSEALAGTIRSPFAAAVAGGLQGGLTMAAGLAARTPARVQPAMAPVTSAGIQELPSFEPLKFLGIPQPELGAPTFGRNALEFGRF